MVNVTAATSFFGTSSEGMWLAGDTKRVSAHRAEELIQEGLAIESSDQSEPSALEQVAGALGASVAPSASDQLAPVAEALGATVVTAPDLKAVTLEGMKENKEKGKTKEDKAKGDTKEAK